MWQLWRLVGFGSMLAVVLVMGSDDVLAQKKDKKAAPAAAEYAATPDEYKKIQNFKELYGSLISIDAASKTLTLRVDTPRMEPNPNYKAAKGAAGGTTNPVAQQYAQLQNTYRDLQRQQQQASLAKNPQERQRALARIQADMNKLQQQQAALQTKMNAAAGKDSKPADAKNQPFISVSSFKDYELAIADEAPVRKLFLNLEYDDTGNPKKYTDAEKRELRGKDATKPGYLAKFDDLQPNQEVKLSMTPPKAKKKDAGPKDEGVGNVDRPTVTMIVMTKELPGGGIQGAPDKKAKKKN